MEMKFKEAAETGGLVLALLAVISGTLKGMFVSRGSCKAAQAACSQRVQKDIADIKTELGKGHEKFANTERYIVAIASKLNVKPEDIPKL